MNNYNGLTLPEVSKYVSPAIASKIIITDIKDLHKMKINVESPLFDFVEYVDKAYHGVKRNFKSFRKRKSNQFFKKIWLYNFVSIEAMFSYNKTRYGLLIKNENIEDKLISKVTFDYIWEVLSGDSLPVYSETFEHYLLIAKKEGAMFAIERMYEEAGIDRSWLWLENHIQERKGKA